MTDNGATKRSASSVFLFLTAFGVLAAVSLSIELVWELCTGVSHHRTHRGVSWGGGTSALATDPSDFWSDIGVQAAIILFFVGFAAYAWRSRKL